MAHVLGEILNRHLSQVSSNLVEHSSPPPPSPPPPGSTIPALTLPALSGGQAILYALVVTAVILVALCLTIRALLLRMTGRGPRATELAAQNAAFQAHGHPNAPVGLNPALVSTFPTAAYDPKLAGTEVGEASCVVCLEEYREGDVLRHLAPCNHAFHVHCIDAWFGQHTTCPVCRVSLQPKGPDDNSGAADDGQPPPDQDQPPLEAGTNPRPPSHLPEDPQQGLPVNGGRSETTRADLDAGQPRDLERGR